MKLTYIGPVQEGQIADALGNTWAVRAGEAVELPDEFANKLITEQPENFTTPAKQKE